MRFLIELAWQELRRSGRSLWVFVACLTLGVTLVTAAGGLYQLLHLSLLADTRALLGGDLEIETREPLPPAILQWLAEHSEFSLVTELHTMLGTAEGKFELVKLQGIVSNYPLYGQLQLQPAADLQSHLTLQDGHWGIAIDRLLADKLNLTVGDKVSIGHLQMQVRTLIYKQPDRSLNANWRGTPALLAQQALTASGLIQAGSRVDYEYRIRTETPAEAWREQLYTTFPNQVWEVRTFKDRGVRIARRLEQIASGLLMIGFSTLLIGGVGVFNSIQTYLQGKLKTIATLRALGLRNRHLTLVYLLQVGILSSGASLLGIGLGAGLAIIGASVIADGIPLTTTLFSLVLPVLSALLFGILTAYGFALPALGRALAVQPAALFRSSAMLETVDRLERGKTSRVGWSWWLATLGCSGAVVSLVLLALPDVQFGLGFVGVIALLLLLLEMVVRLLQTGARKLDQHSLLDRRFALRLALTNLYRPGNHLRTLLLSLGSALTLLVACTLVVVSLLRTVNSTIPEDSPALVMYDILPDQLTEINTQIQVADAEARITIAPLVRARMKQVNNTPLEHLSHLSIGARREALEDEYKLSYLLNNIDEVTIVSGQWWEDDVISGLPKIALEDREAYEVGIKVGDKVIFNIQDQPLMVEVAAIYSQKGLQTRYWFEGILQQGSLDPFINRYVGTAHMSDQAALQAQNQIAAQAPNVIMVRTAELLNAARDLLGKASTGLAVVAVISLTASLLVLSSVMAAGRARQIYHATVLHSLGTRVAVIRRSLYAEYLLLAVLTALFAIALGSAIALPLLQLRMKLPSHDLLWSGASVGIVTSILSLGLGTRYLLARLRISPAILLRDVE